jgi:predicted dithiol-disulfide oxidoreductase (DUF899 family)
LEKEKAVADAKKAVEAAKSKLDAWLTADAKLATRLADVDKAIKNLQAIFGGPDQVFAIYLLWFQVLPPHTEIAPPGSEKDLPACLTPPLDEKAVRLVKPSDYRTQLEAAWTDYRAARVALKAAEDALKTFQDEVADETAKLKTMRDHQDEDVKKKLEPPA